MIRPPSKRTFHAMSSPEHSTWGPGEPADYVDLTAADDDEDSLTDVTSPGNASIELPDPPDRSRSSPTASSSQELNDKREAGVQARRYSTLQSLGSTLDLAREVVDMVKDKRAARAAGTSSGDLFSAHEMAEHQDILEELTRALQTKYERQAHREKDLREVREEVRESDRKTRRLHKKVEEVYSEFFDDVDMAQVYDVNGVAVDHANYVSVVASLAHIVECSRESNKEFRKAAEAFRKGAKALERAARSNERAAVAGKGWGQGSQGHDVDAEEEREAEGHGDAGESMKSEPEE